MKIWLAFGTGKSLRFISAHDIATALGPEKCNALPMCHALTGCDTVSAFAGRGKRTAWAVWESFPELTDALSEVNHEQTDITESCMSIIARFVILMYDRTSTCSDINTARKKLFAKNQFRLHTTLWCSMFDVQCTKDPYAGVRHYILNLSSHVQVSGVGKRHLEVSSNRFGQHYRKLQRSAMNLSGVDAQKDVLVGAGVRSLHFHAHHFVLVMGNATETRKVKRQ